MYRLDLIKICKITGIFFINRPASLNRKRNARFNFLISSLSDLRYITAHCKSLREMCRRTKNSSKRNRKTHARRSRAARGLRNSLSDFVLTQSKGDRRGSTWRNSTGKESSELFSRRVRSLATTGGRTKSIAIDRDKRFKRKRRPQLDMDAYMDTLLPIKKKGTTCIPTSGSRESRDRGIIGGGPRTLLNASEIAGQIPATKYLSSSGTGQTDVSVEKNIGTDWVIADLDSRSEKVLKFLYVPENLETRTSEDNSHSSHLTQLDKCRNEDEDHRKSFAVKRREGSMPAARLSTRSSCIEGMLEAKRSDCAEIQCDVSRSANVVQGAIEESSIENDYPPIGRGTVHHRFETPRVSARRKIFTEAVERERTKTSFGHRDRHGGIANPIFSFFHRPDSRLPDNDLTLADKSMSVARNSGGKFAMKKYDAEASGENVYSRGGYLDEDYHFLMSLHRQLNGMPLVRKMKVKAKIQTIFYEEVRTRIRKPRRATAARRENSPALCSTQEGKCATCY